MKTPTDEMLERFFSGLCAKEAPIRMPQAAWPAVAERLADHRPPPRSLLSVRPVLVPACAALLAIAVLAWTHPGSAAEVVAKVRRMLTGSFEFTIGGSAPVSKEVSVAEGEPTRLDLGEHEAEVTMTEMDGDAVKTTVRFSRKAPDGTEKVLMKPSVLTRKGTRAEITVSDSEGKKPVYRIRVVPRE